MPYAIRPSEFSDTEILGKVHSQAWQETYPGLMPADVLAQIGSVDARTKRRHHLFASTTPQSGHFLVEDGKGAVVGFGDCGPVKEVKDYAPSEIYTLYLLRSAQGKGLGKQLLSKMIKHLAENGFDKMAVKTHNSGTKTRGFYEYCGGHNVGEVVSEHWTEAVYVWNNLKDFSIR